MQFSFQNLSVIQSNYYNKIIRAAVDGTPSQMPTVLPLTFTLGLRLHKMLPNTLYIMSPMHLQIMKLQCPTVKEEMHLQ